MRHYCTLFDSRYLPQGLVLYESLLKHSSEPFTLYVLPMDQECKDVLASLPLLHMKVLKSWWFESEMGMTEIKGNRTHQEYCWTCASNLCQHLFNFGGIDELTYLDSDMMFFSDPKVIHDEIDDRSIAVIPHRLIPSKRHLEVNGKFNVSWVTFKNNPVGRECLSTWAAQCREKCSATDGCGDQKYLDAWPDKYGPELCVIQNIGAGLAPWNLANFTLHKFKWPEERDEFLRVQAPNSTAFNWKEVVFYHFHEYLHGQRLTNYELRPEDRELIYKPYIEAVNEAKAKLAPISV